jgi:hypothetical protein
VVAGVTFQGHRVHPFYGITLFQIKLYNMTPFVFAEFVKCSSGLMIKVTMASLEFSSSNTIERNVNETLLELLELLKFVNGLLLDNLSAGKIKILIPGLYIRRSNTPTKFLCGL